MQDNRQHLRLHCNHLVFTEEISSDYKDSINANHCPRLSPLPYLVPLMKTSVCVCGLGRVGFNRARKFKVKEEK